MTARHRATILGCGASPGVPRIGNDWGACDPNEPRNRRTRCSLLLERFADDARPTRVLIDTSPDMRAQLLAADVDWIDAVVYTHAHADHVHGIDDLRAFWLQAKKRVPVYGDDPTVDHLLHAFAYCFTRSASGLYPAILEHHRIRSGTPLTIDGAGGPLTLMPFRQVHGDIDTLGVRVGSLAYSCDVSDVPPESLPRLADLDIWILDALRHTPHPSHLSVADATAWVDRLKPRRAIFTHMHGDLDYAALKRSLPPTIEPAYDGMTLDFEA